MEKQRKNSTGKNGNPTPPGFKKGKSGNPKGRPPKLLTELSLKLKEEGFEPLKPSQLLESLGLILNLPEAKIKELSKDKENPFALRIISEKLLSENSFSFLEKILDRTIGKPTLSIDHTTQGEKIGKNKFDNLTIEELERIFEERGLPKPNLDLY
ncbi:MAG: hypothetical protein O9346_17395 [Leptospiraceae bacterium]|nr:hypothetical protein [Leptospiraceae bacterium]